MPQRRLGLLEILGERVGEPEVGQHRWLLGIDLQGAGVITLCFRVPAELVEYRALRRKNPPVGLIGRMGAVEHLKRLLQIADLRQRLAVGSEQDGIARLTQGSLLEDRDGLRTLAAGAQRLRIGEGDVRVARFGTILGSQAFGFAPPIDIRLGGCRRVDRGYLVQRIQNRNALAACSHDGDEAENREWRRPGMRARARRGDR